MTTQPSPSQMPPADPPGARFERVAPDDRRPAATRLLSPPGGEDEAAADRFLQYAADHDLPLDLMWAARASGDRLIAAVLVVPNPGRTAVVFASAAGSREETAAVARLIDHACRQLDPAAVNLAQVLVDPGDAATRSAFTAAGFSMLARISYLERPLTRRRPMVAAAPPPGVTMVPYDDSREGDVLGVLEASYVDTLDCPGLRGLRRTEDILAGHRGSGAFDPALWTVLYDDHAARGVLMLNPAPGSDTIELVYLGLDRAVRGRGLGQLLLRHGLGMLRDRRERAVTLAVDDRNAPAVRLYRGEGFRRVLRRTALIRAIPPNGG